MTTGKSREDYLEAIYVLQQRNGFVRSVDVARHLNFSQASVCSMIASLEAEGYVEKLSRAPYNLTLTSTGQHLAEQTFARHRFFRQLLVFAGVDEETAEREACELEHDISQESFHLLRTALAASVGAE